MNIDKVTIEQLKSGLLDGFEQIRIECSGLDSSQFTYKPSPESWSVSECVEHLAVVDGGIARGISKGMNSGEAPNYVYGTISPRFPSREHKISAPDRVRPIQNSGEVEAVCANLLAARQMLVQMMEQHPEKLSQFSLPHGVMGNQNGWAWIEFLIAHGQRHLAQIREIKANLPS